MRCVKSCRIVMLLVMQMAFFALLNPAAGAAPLGTILHQDGFAVDGVERQYGGNLDSTAIGSSPLKWAARDGMVFADISGQDIVRSAWGSSTSAVINADLALVGGTFKIEADVMPLGTASADNWVALGFQPGQTPAGYGTAGLWMLFRGNGGYQIFHNGTSTVIGQAASFPGYVQGQVAHVSIMYDSATNIATFSVNDQVILTKDIDLDIPTSTFPAAAKRPFIITYDTGQWFDNFTVSMEGGTVPVVTVLQSPANDAHYSGTDLSWALAFPAANVTFDVYLDPNEPRVTNLDASARVSADQTGFNYDPNPALQPDTQYYWRVVTKVDGNPVQTSDVRHFLSRSEKWSDVAWMTDDDLDLSAGKVYTHKVKFNANDENYVANVLGFEFERDNNRSGSNWSMTGAPNTHTGSEFWGSGEGIYLNTRFYYGSPAALTLTGLAPGVKYRTTFFTHAWGDKGTRFVDITTSDDGKVRRLDENVGHAHNGRLFMYTYTAPESGNLTFTFNAVGAGAWHHYSFSNEVATDIYLDPTPMPGLPILNNGDLSWQLNGQVANLSYHLIVANDPNLVDKVVDTALPENTYSINLPTDKTYYWKVEVLDGGVAVHTSPVWNFSTYSAPKWSDASWMADADLDLSPGKIYTHKVKLNAVSEEFVTSVLGLDFENDNNRSGANWSLTGNNMNANAGTHFTGTGEGVALNTRFNYYPYNAAILTLTGLTPGTEYRTTFYTHGWGNPKGRFNRVTTSDDGRTLRLDENKDGDGRGRLFMYNYTAPESGSLIFEFLECVDNTAWHQYSFSNEIAAAIYLDPTPMPGSQAQADLILSWQLNGAVTNPTYNLTIATDPNMLNVVVQQTGIPNSYHASLDPEKNYYWKVQVVENGGPVVHTSPVWSFLTSPPPDAEKVLEWKMDETAGPIVNQTGSSEDADGNLTGFNDPNGATMFVTGLVGNALLLNGTSEYLDVSAANPYMPTGNEQAFAVSGYFRTFKAYGPIFSMRSSTTGTPLIDITVGHDGAYEAAGRLRMLVRDDGDNISPPTDSGITVNDGRWHSLVVMRARGNWLMYVDGIERARLVGVASGAVTLDWLAIGSSKRWILDEYGSWNGSRTDIRYFEGMIDEVCIWSGELRARQIQELAALVPPQGDLDFDRDTDPADLKILAANWLTDSFTAVQSSPVILEDMESYTSDPNTFKGHWEALNGGVSLENVFGNVVTAPTDASVGASVNSMVDDALYGNVLRWDYTLPADKRNAIQRFWLRDRRIDLAAYDHIRIRVKKLAGSTGDQFYFDFHDGRGMTNPEQGIYPWVLAWQGRIIQPLANVPEDQWITLEADIPGGFNSGRPKQLHDFYEVTIGINSAGVARAGTILIDEIVLSDSTTDCFANVGELLPDMTGDCKVNIEDFALMAANWLKGM